MKDNRIAATILLLLVVLLLPSPKANAVSDAYYDLSGTSTVWDGTYADRLTASTLDYNYTYGDERSVSYTLPWPITFYGQTYTNISADTNGNVWFTATGPANSFVLASTGPVVATCNNDLSSYYYGGVFIQRKTNPERVVIEWQNETYTDEGEYLPNDLEMVIFSNGSVRFDYLSFGGANLKDSGSGISGGGGASNLNLTALAGPVYTLQNASFMFLHYPILTVIKAGTGTGRVTSIPAGIDCGPGCSTASAIFQNNANVNLTAASDPNCSFVGWSGGCSGTSTCPMTLSADAAVTATFNMPPPTCDFTGSPTSGTPPLTVSFLDLSQWATSWLWSFGDNATSTQENPDHIYQNPGNYTVSLTVSNATGSCTATKANYITIGPVRIARQTPVYFMTITDAYAAAANGETIQCQAISFNENLNFNQAKSVTLEAGYDTQFTTSCGVTTIHGAFSITAGSASITAGTIDLEP